MNKYRSSYIKLVLIFAAAVSILSTTMHCLAYGEENRLVRVGYFDYDGYFEIDKNGNLTGYGVDLLDRIAQYTGWQYEYVPGSWNEILTMLENREIDLLSVAQYSPERAEKFIYSRHSSGNGQSLLYVAADRDDLYYSDYDAFDGMKIGVMRGNMHQDMLRAFAEMNGFSYEAVPYDEETQAVEMIRRGEIDAMISVSENRHQDLKLVSRLGSEPFYFISFKNNEKLMEELEDAISQFKAEDPHFEYTLYEKYLDTSKASSQPTFTRQEAEYIRTAPSVSIAVTRRPPWVYDEDDGEPAGIIIDILNEMTRISGLSFDIMLLPVDYPSIDAVTGHQAELSIAILDNNMIQSHRELDVSKPFIFEFAVPVGKRGLSYNLDAPLKVAVPEAFTVCLNYLEDYYPHFTIVTYANASECIEAVFDGQTHLMMGDVLVVNLLLQRPIYEELDVIPNFTIPEDYYVVSSNSQDKTLMSVINKTIVALNQNTVNSYVINQTVGNPYAYTPTDLLYRYKVPALCIAILSLMLIILMLRIRKQNIRHLAELSSKNVKLEEAILEAQSASRAKGDFLSRMSHEIRTPLNAITGSIAIANSSQELPVKAREYLQKALTASGLLLSIINDILDMSAIESSKMKLAYEPFDIENLLNSLDSIYEEQCRQKGVIYQSHIQSLRHPILIGDSLRVNQILINILSNAVKFTPAGKSVTATAEQMPKTDDSALMLFTITDTGEGMSEEMLLNLFRPFEQEDGTTARKHGGSGLGLSITKSLVEMMGGTIHVESIKGHGSTFTVELTFPYGSEAYNKEAITPISTADAVRDFSGRKILLAEDNEINGEITTELLTQAGITTDWVRNGSEAVAAFDSAKENTYQLILMDIQMPVMDGYEAAMHIRSLNRTDASTIPIIALTADAFKDDVDKAVTAGMNGHLSKPIDMKLFYDILEKYMQQ